MLLWVDACIRKQSRTRLLAEHLLTHLQEEEIQRIFLPGESIPASSEELLRLRKDSQSQQCFDHPYFDWAKQLMNAETVVIAAPYWDLSFPSILKSWLEAVCVSGLTFSYGEDNLPHSHCKLKTLYYLTTSGGPIINADYGFGYVRCVMENFFGAQRCYAFSAEHLDEYGQNPEMILQNTKDEIDAFFHSIVNSLPPAR